jgi:predicted transcriptional regulator
MNNAKAEIQQILKELPDDVTFEEIQYQLYVRHAIAQGLRDIEEGRLVDQAEAERRMSKWLKS